MKVFCLNFKVCELKSIFVNSMLRRAKHQSKMKPREDKKS